MIAPQMKASSLFCCINIASNVKTAEAYSALITQKTISYSVSFYSKYVYGDLFWGLSIMLYCVI